jgi:CRP/FNR family transcriptional regulator, cyclic AMP receptor protein
MARIGWVEGIGYLASLLVFCTFYMKTIIALRGVAIASNLAFMTYGLAGGLYPVFVLHVVLLPLNCLRLHQMQHLIRKVRTAARGDLSTESLIPLMTRQRFPKGDVLFRMGDRASSMCLVLSGSDTRSDEDRERDESSRGAAVLVAPEPPCPRTHPPRPLCLDRSWRS